MRIYFDDSINVYPTDHPWHRGETRWLSNWRHILKKAGHEIVPRGVAPDLVFSILTQPDPLYPTVPHVLLWFGKCGSHNIVQSQVSRDLSLVAAPFMHIWPPDPGHDDCAVLLPIPLDRTWLPTNLAPPITRTEITWAVKQIWMPDLPPHYANSGIWTLEALADLSRDHEFVLNIVLGHDLGSDFTHAPPAAMEALARIPNVNRVQGPLPLPRLLELFSNSRLALTAGGLLGSSLEAVFCGAVPMAHRGLTLSHLAEERVGVLPEAAYVTKEETRAELHRLFLDDTYYMDVHACYQESLTPHMEENAIIMFDKVIEHFNL